MGLSAALLLREKNCSVTIIARNMEKLNAAKELVDSKTRGCLGSLDVASADVSNCEEIQAAIKKCCEKHNNRVDVCIMSAGVSRPGKLHEVPVKMYENMININYLGSLYTAMAVVPMMKEQRSGRLMFVSSLAGLTSVIGFAGYTSSKFAVRGLAQVLQMELKPFNIYTSLVNPPDVETPMLADEMQYKCEECKIISSDGGLFQPEDVANDIISAIKSWRFMVNTGFDGWLLGLVSTDLSTPSHSTVRTIIEIVFSGLMRFVSLCYLTSWNRTCAQIHSKNTTRKSGRADILDQLVN
jgi:3-dehydrosphinganine reductase